MKVRLATPADQPAIDRCFDEQEAILGVKVDRPDLFKSPVLITVVAEDDNGFIRQAAYGEAIVEFCLVGADPRGTVAIRKDAPNLIGFFRSRGFRWARMFVPSELKKILSKPLRKIGFTYESDALTHFSMRFRKE